MPSAGELLISQAGERRVDEDAVAARPVKQHQPLCVGAGGDRRTRWLDTAAPHDTSRLGSWLTAAAATAPRPL